MGLIDGGGSRLLHGQKRSRVNWFLAGRIRLMVHPFSGLGRLTGNQVEGVSRSGLFRKRTPRQVEAQWFIWELIQGNPDGDTRE